MEYTFTLIDTDGTSKVHSLPEMISILMTHITQINKKNTEDITTNNRNIKKFDDIFRQHSNKITDLQDEVRLLKNEIKILKLKKDIGE